MNNIVYWTMKNGQKIDVDTMDVQHLRNTLKMLIRSIEAAKVKTKAKPRFQMNGEIAQDHIDQGYFNEQQDYDPRDEWFER